MAEQPLVSIVTPSYNQGDYLEQTIQSVLSQDYPYLEYIIIDGGSTDDSVRLIHQYEDRLAYWVSEPDRGQSHAINKGLRRAKGEFLSWLNSDDTLTPGAVSRVVEAMTSLPEVDLVYGRANWIDHQGRIIFKARASKKPPSSSPASIFSPGITQAGAFWRQRIMEQMGLLDESLHFVMDYDLWARMALAGGKFHRLQGEPIANRRMSVGTKTASQNDRMGLEHIFVIDRLLANPDLSKRLGVPRPELELRARKAKAVACMRVSFAYSRRPSHRKDALGWLFKAMKLYPPILFTKNFIKTALYYRFME